MKLIIHELDAVLSCLAADELGPAQKGLARVKQIQRQLFEQWGVLATLTPSEYVKFRDVLGTRPGSSRCSTGSSSSCSATRTARCSRSSATRRRRRRGCARRSRRRRSTTSSCATWPAAATRCRTTAWSATSPSPTAAAGPAARFKAIYDAPKRDWEAYEMCEELVDVEEPSSSGASAT